MNKIFSLAFGAVSLGLVMAAQAAPQLLVNIYENHMLVDTLTASSSNGNVRS